MPPVSIMRMKLKVHLQTNVGLREFFFVYGITNIVGPLLGR